MYASRIKSIWFNDKYVLNSLPSSIRTDYILIVDSLEEAIKIHRKDIIDNFNKKNIQVDFNHVFFEISMCEIYNKKITWLLTKYHVIKLTDIEDNTLPNCKFLIKTK